MSDASLSLIWDWTRLRLLVEIERHGSVSAAARELGIGQPTASAHLRKLERSAGQRLVERNGRGSTLTEAGRVLATHAAEAISTLNTGEEELRALAGLDGGRIRLGASSTPGTYLLPDTLGCFRDDHPNVSVEVEIASTAEILDRLRTGAIQLALVGETTAEERIRLEPFLDDEIVGVAPPGLLNIQAGRAKPRELAQHTMLVRSPGSSTRRLAEAAFARAGAQATTTWELDSSEAIKRAARAGLGYSFLSRYAVIEEIERGDLEAFRIAGAKPITRTLCIAHLSRCPLSPSEKWFVSTLTRCCRKDAEYAIACLA